MSLQLRQGRVEFSDGIYWYKDGMKHREDGPAIEHYDGSKYWYVNSKRHREDGPAIEHYDGTRVWYQYGKRHREDGPAVEYASGTRCYYINGQDVPDEDLHLFDSEEGRTILVLKYGKPK